MTRRKVLSALAGLALVAGTSVALAPAADAATCNTHSSPPNMPSWGWGSWCVRTDSRGYQWFRFKIDDTAEDTFCVYLATAYNGKWARETQVNTKSCGPLVSNEFIFHTGSFDDRDMWGVRVYRENGNYFTLCDGPNLRVANVPDCS